MLRVSKIFSTIQGEGTLQGVPSVFIRLNGCNLNCVWCDLEYDASYTEFQLKSPQEVVAEANSLGLTHVVITGGEPMVQRDIVELTSLLKSQGYHITIETNGTIKRNVKADLLSLSPKLSNSGMNYKRRFVKETLDFYFNHYDYQIKFVISGKCDLKEVEEYIEECPSLNKNKILLMPLASTLQELEKRRKNIIRICMSNNYRYCDRLQLSVWNNSEEI